MSVIGTAAGRRHIVKKYSLNLSAIAQWASLRAGKISPRRGFAAQVDMTAAVQRRAVCRKSPCGRLSGNRARCGTRVDGLCGAA